MVIKCMAKTKNNKNSNQMIAIILLAGMGSRLGRPHPKSLTPLDKSQTILSRQLKILKQHNLQICCVVGFKKDLIMEAANDCIFVYNPNYDLTNTSKSLLTALRQFQDRDIIWLNGDVVFSPEIIARILASTESAVAVNNSRVSDEEVKYTLNNDGYIEQISKEVRKPLGEALGINLIRRPFVENFIDHLQGVENTDYFEKGMEQLIKDQGNVFKAIDVSDLPCIEVDFEADLEQAMEMLQNVDR